MSLPETSIRIARLSDLLGIMQLHEKAFAGSMGVRLGKLYQGAFLSWFIKHPRAQCLVAVDAEDRIIGYVFGSDYEALSMMNRVVAPAAALGMLSNWQIALEKPFQNELKRRLRSLPNPQKILSRVMSNKAQANETVTDSGIFSLVGIGVDSSHRRQGIGSSLIKRFEEEATNRNKAAVRLSVYKTNNTARSAYVRAGFVEQIHPDSDATLFYIKTL